MSKLILVEELSTFLITYVVELEDDEPKEYAMDTVCMKDDSLKEFTQKHIYNIPISSRKISKEEYMNLLLENEEGIYSNWTEEQKLTFINKKQDD